MFSQGPPIGSAIPGPAPHQLTSSPTSRNRSKIPTVPDRPASDPCPWPAGQPPEPGTTESVVSHSMRQVGSKVFILSHRNIQEIKNSSCLHSSPTEPTNQPDRPTENTFPTEAAPVGLSELTCAHRLQAPLLPRTAAAGPTRDRPQPGGLPKKLPGDKCAWQAERSSDTSAAVPWGKESAPRGVTEARFEKFCVHRMKQFHLCPRADNACFILPQRTLQEKVTRFLLGS